MTLFFSFGACMAVLVFTAIGWYAVPVVIAVHIGGQISGRLIVG